MVDQSELAFRQLGRKYGCDLCYTPMLHSKIFSETPKYRRENFQTDETDRPLVVQFCANNPDTLLRAATLVAGHCDAVDVNFGCPQDIARRGRYGAFLMDDPDRVHDLILTLKESLPVPVWAKFRIFPDLADTLRFARMVEAAGASAVAVHGRTRQQRGNDPGPADWEAIAAVKAALRIPVIANGNVRTYEDARACLDVTGWAGRPCVS
jgi:tRNA-dihydrouridine synthase 1